MVIDTVHQCPRCELRFAFRPELEDHVRRDHEPTPGDDVPAPGPASAGTLTVPVDPAREPGLAIAIAASLARQAGMRVDIVAVTPFGFPADAYLDARVREATAAGAPEARGNLLVTAGTPATAIVESAERTGPLLLCMATHDRTRVGDAVLGSVSAAVVRRSPVPVLLVGPGVHDVGERVRRLVTCVDGSELSERALPAAAEVAGRLDAEIVLVEVVPTEQTAPSLSAQPELAYLHDLADRIPGPPMAFDIVHAHEPATGIARYVADRDDTIVVMGTHGRSGLGKLVMGSVSREVVHRADCGVLVVPPRAMAQTTG